MCVSSHLKDWSRLTLMLRPLPQTLVVHACVRRLHLVGRGSGRGPGGGGVRQRGQRCRREAGRHAHGCNSVGHVRLVFSFNRTFNVNKVSYNSWIILSAISEFWLSLCAPPPRGLQYSKLADICTPIVFSTIQQIAERTYCVVSVRNVSAIDVTLCLDVYFNCWICRRLLLTYCTSLVYFKRCIHICLLLLLYLIVYCNPWIRIRLLLFYCTALSTATVGSINVYCYPIVPLFVLQLLYLYTSAAILLYLNVFCNCWIRLRLLLSYCTSMSSATVVSVYVYSYSIVQYHCLLLPFDPYTSTAVYMYCTLLSTATVDPYTSTVILLYLIIYSNFCVCILILYCYYCISLSTLTAVSVYSTAILLYLILYYTCNCWIRFVYCYPICSHCLL